jgi:GGDEF domain-containing protein
MNEIVKLRRRVRDCLRRNVRRRSEIVKTGGDEFSLLVRAIDNGLTIRDLDQFQENFIFLSASQFSYILPAVLLSILDDLDGAAASQGVFSFWSAIANPEFNAVLEVTQREDKEIIVNLVEFIRSEKSDLGIIIPLHERRILERLQ